MPDTHPTALEYPITVTDVAKLTGCTVEFVTQVTGETGDFDGLRYRKLEGDEERAVISEIEKALGEDRLNRAGSHAIERWEHGWSEVLREIETHGFSAEALTPQYFRHDILRYNGGYIRASAPGFEYRFYEILRRVLFSRYLTNYARIVEFGCGTGSNLHLLHQMFPLHQFIGCDWARPSQKIIRRLATETGGDIHANRFDMFTLEGRDEIEIDGATAIITMHALEQLGDGFGPFLDYLIAARPGISFHLEPIAEFYDPHLPFDENALEYHNKRKYLSGFLTRIHELEDNGKLEILEAKRLGFGSMYQEAYSLIVWRPAGV